MAQVDTSIYNALGTRQKSMADYTADLDAADLRKQGMQQNALALQMGQQKLGEYERSIQDANALRGVVSKFGADPAQNVMSLYGAGRLTEAQAYQKAIDESRKTNTDVVKSQAEAQKTQLANGIQQFEIMGQLSQGVVDQATHDRMRQQAAERFGPEFAAKIPAVYNPQEVETNKARAVSIVEQMKQRLQQIQQEEAIRHNRATEGLTARGQNLTDARARESVGAARVPSGYRAKPDGTLEFIPGGPADPATKPASGNLSEGERKAATLLTRLRGSQSQLQAALDGAPQAAKPGVAAEVLRNTPLIGGDTPANLITPAARQQVEAAQLDMLDAALTLGTGAAYTKEQLRGYAKSYFPQIGDDEATVADKKARLETIVQAAEIAAGRGAELAPKFDKPAAKPGGAAPVKVTSDADYNALKPGTRFVTPDGKTGTKR